MNSVTPTARVQRRYEEIAARLHELVRTQNLQPGDRLPPERQLAELFGVSRTSVREALKSLEQHGVLVCRPGAGTFIAEHSPMAIAHAFEQVFTTARSHLADIFELRLVLEPQVAYLAAQRITDEDCRALQRHLRDHEQAISRNEPTVPHDLAFHQRIALATGNQAIVQLIEQLQDMLLESRDEALQSARRMHCSLAAHQLIRDALCRREPNAAKAAMAMHLEQTRNLLFTSTCGD